MNPSRRQFFAKTLSAAAGLIVAPQLLQNLFSSQALAADCPAVVVGQGMAASVNYAEDKKKVKKDLQIDRMGVPFAKQNCASCGLYTANPDGKAGKCALFAGQCVKPASWCGSWNKKS